MKNPAAALRRSVRGRPLLVVIAVLAVLAMLACIGALWFGVAWYRAAHDGSLDLAVARDRVIPDAQTVAATLNTLDYQRVEPGLDLWLRNSTGPLAEEFRTNRGTYAKAIRDARSKTEAKAVEAAVSELDLRAGTSRVLVAVDVTVTVEGQPPTVRRPRLQLDMVRTDRGWKASAIEIVGSGGP